MFTTVNFIFLLLPLFLIIYFILPVLLRNFSIVIFSLFLTLLFHPISAVILLFSICLNYSFGLIIGKKGNVWMLAFGIILNVALLSGFKYYQLLFNLFHAVTDIISSSPSQTTILSTLILPLGISFYTFRAISYLVDIYRKKTEPEYNIIDFSTYLALFPIFIAGPIARYVEVKSDLHARKLSFQQIAGGIERFIIGLARKVIIADTLGSVADQIFSTPIEDLSTPLAWLGIISYTMQIFFDFSGYTDMAIGIGMMLGFTFPENFNYPYISKNIREFWRRWHMTLSTWLRDYLFLPIAYSLSRKWKKNRYAGIKTDNLLYTVAAMITFAICGIWHGSTISFLMWGVYYALFMIFEQVFFKRTLARLFTPIQHIYTILVVMGGWVLFRIEGLDQALMFYHKLFVYSAGSAPSNSYLSFFVINFETFVILIASIILSTPVLSNLKTKLIALSGNGKGISRAYTLIRLITLLLLLIISLSFVVAQTYHPFIYFRF